MMQLMKMGMHGTNSILNGYLEVQSGSLVSASKDYAQMPGQLV